jgi:Holliday junction resolvasome RuvABC ATP-dependent DNA helicase subunit
MFQPQVSIDKSSGDIKITEINGTEISLTSKETFRLITDLQRILFDWKNITGEKSIDKPECQ